MLYKYPENTVAKCNSDYVRPYEDPIVVSRGDKVKPIEKIETDFIGWTWCVADDGRAGWTPENWCNVTSEFWLLKRDFSALELTVSRGDLVELLFSESGFVFCRTKSGLEGWLPDAALTLQVK